MLAAGSPRQSGSPVLRLILPLRSNRFRACQVYCAAFLGTTT